MKNPGRIKTAFRRINYYAGTVAHGFLTILALAVVAVMVYRSAGKSVESKAETDRRALAILRNLRTEIKSGAAHQMQSYFPEGACFLNTLYGLAWANLALEQGRRDEAIPEIQTALAGQETPVALEPFRWDTQVRRGSFWMSQRNLLLGKYLALNPGRSARVTSLTEEFHANSRSFYKAVMTGPVHQVETYSGMCWPADATAGLASLKIHDGMFGTTYSEALVAWKDYHGAHGWNDTILPPGRLDYKTGQHIEPARGCANSFMIATLAEADPEYAAKLYRAYQEHFEIARCGFSMFREYPKGNKGVADADSGPIIMGAGVVATGIGLAAVRAVGDTDTERDIRDLSDMLGFAWTGTNDIGQETTKYLGGVLPLGDAFLAWGYSIPRPAPPIGDFGKAPAKRWVFYVIVLFVLAATMGQWFVLWRRGKRRFRQMEASMLDVVS